MVHGLLTLTNSSICLCYVGSASHLLRVFWCFPICSPSSIYVPVYSPSSVPLYYFPLPLSYYLFRFWPCWAWSPYWALNLARLYLTLFIVLCSNHLCTSPLISVSYCLPSYSLLGSSYCWNAKCDHEPVTLRSIGMCLYMPRLLWVFSGM